MNLVGSKAATQPTESFLKLTEKTSSLEYWKIASNLDAKARHSALLDYLEGKRLVQTKPECPSPEAHFKHFLDKESDAKAAQAAANWHEITHNDPLLQECLHIQNDPLDPNPLPQGRPRSSEEVKAWRLSVPVSKQSVMQYITYATGQSLEGPNHAGSKALVQEFLPPKYFSVYSDGLTDEQIVQVNAAKPLDGLELQFLIKREVSLNTDIVRYTPGDDLAVIKSKISDLPTAERSLNEYEVLCSKNSTKIDKLNGELEAFLLKHMPVVASICPEHLRDKKYALVWKLVHEHFIAKTKRSPSKATNATLPDFNSRVDTVASYQRSMGEYLGQRQVVAQEAHVGSRGLKKLSYLEATTACIALSDSQYTDKYPTAEYASKETKDVHIRELLRDKFEASPLFSERITAEERKNPDVTIKELFEALSNEETLHSVKKILDDTIVTKTSVNAVSSESGSHSLTCAIHGQGNHDSDNCRMLKQETVIFDTKKNSYVYKDSGAPYKGGKSSHSDKAHADGPKPKKDKKDKDNKYQGKKDEKKKDSKDKEKDKQQRKKERKNNKEVVAALDGLKTTFVNMITQSSPSSATASTAPTLAQATPSQDSAIVLAALDKQFKDLKKSIGLVDEP